MTHSHPGLSMYQPNAFTNSGAAVRGDCGVRYIHILKSLEVNGVSDVVGKKILDFGCAEGYFGFKFLQDGAKHITFIDNDEGCLKYIENTALDHGMFTKIKVYPALNWTEEYDIALLLDLWGHGSLIPSLEKFHAHSKILFVSTSGNGNTNNKKLYESLKLLYKNIESIYQGYENRTIFRCIK